jgi:hypothetical protein
MSHARPLRTALCTLSLLLLALPAAAAVRLVNPTGACGGSPCYTDLQSAIDASAPGDLIGVQAGVYPLAATVLVHRSVGIYGPQAGVNPLPSRGTTRVAGGTNEAVFDGGGTLGVLIRVLADDVVLDGIEVRNGTGDLIESTTGTPTRGTRVRNCIVHDALGDEGVQLRAVTDGVVECNHVYATAGDGINLCCTSVDGHIRFNEVHDIASENAAIYVYSSTGTVVEGNLVYNTTTNEGIKLGAKYGPDAGLAGGMVFNNTVHHTAQDGIAIYTSYAAASCNDVSHSTSENGGIYVAWAVSNVSITDNYVHDNTFNPAKWGDPAGIMIGTEPDAATITVSGNVLHGNVPNGVTNRAAAPLAATGNWWGDAGGPSGAGPGAGDAVSANVAFDPWLTSPPVLSCPAIGTCEGGNPTPAPSTTWGRLKTLYR